ncbi:MAG TPA: L-seryl-tRNA(Sec) selenium transferase [Firmicutes bacterium]|nr:L-seryl-tRNA(Sec) selenium transferase [Bacillota bacterium]
MEKQEILRNIPRVDDVINAARHDDGLKNVSYATLAECVRNVLDSIRKDVLSGKITAEVTVGYAADMAVRAAREAGRHNLRAVINATGVVLHTNLGRAVLPPSVAENIKQVAMQYNTLEYSLDEGGRGSRHDHVESLICKLTGAEAAMAVNNNAAAVMLMLAAVGKDREIIVSRGELVEIGGSFRVPEIMSMSGARLKEVGTTNKTNPGDYKNAVNENTAALLKVHTSNFKLVGFCDDVKIEEMAAIGKAAGLPVLYDVGSGLMVDGALLGIQNEPSAKDALAAGADVVCFSGDKLLGGPQAGILAGKKKYIDMMKKHQFARVVRIDKLTLAALEATLRIYLDGDRAMKEIPTLANLAADKTDLRVRAKKLLAALPSMPDKFTAAVKAAESQVGGGSAPGEMLPSFVVQITPVAISAAEAEKRLRECEIPVIARIHQDKLLLDPRTIFDSQYKEVAKAVGKVFA